MKNVFLISRSHSSPLSPKSFVEHQLAGVGVGEPTYLQHGFSCTYAKKIRLQYIRFLLTRSIITWLHCNQPAPFFSLIWSISDDENDRKKGGGNPKNGGILGRGRNILFKTFLQKNLLAKAVSIPFEDIPRNTGTN